MSINYDATIISPVRKDKNLFDVSHVIEIEWDFEKTLTKNLFATWTDLLNLRVRVATCDVFQEITISENEKIIISDFFWYAFNKEKAIELFGGLDIIIVCLESKPNGYQYMDQNWGHTQRDTLDQEYLSNFSSVSYIIDNSSPMLTEINSDVNFFPSYSWSKEWLRQLHPESPTYIDNLLRKSDDTSKHDWHNHQATLEDYFTNWNTISNEYTLSLGTYKAFRLDLCNKLTTKGLADNGYIGTYCETWNLDRLEEHKEHIDNMLTEPIDYDNFPDIFPNLPGDRKQGYDLGGAGGFTYNQQCLFGSKLDIIVESVAEPNDKMNEYGIKHYNGKPFPISQLTEKTCRAMLLGKPFLLVTTTILYQQLQEWGFDLYTDVFGNYIGKDFEETNNNICDIISDMKNGKQYDVDLIKRISAHNYNNIPAFILPDSPGKIAEQLNFM
jgi:hypothetical protein